MMVSKTGIVYILQVDIQASFEIGTITVMYSCTFVMECEDLVRNYHKICVKE